MPYYSYGIQNSYNNPGGTNSWNRLQLLDRGYMPNLYNFNWTTIYTATLDTGLPGVFVECGEFNQNYTGANQWGMSYVTKIFQIFNNLQNDNETIEMGYNTKNLFGGGSANNSGYRPDSFRVRWVLPAGLVYGYLQVMPRGWNYTYNTNGDCAFWSIYATTYMG